MIKTKNISDTSKLQKNLELEDTLSNCWEESYPT